MISNKAITLQELLYKFEKRIEDMEEVVYDENNLEVKDRIDYLEDGYLEAKEDILELETRVQPLENGIETIDFTPSVSFTTNNGNIAYRDRVGKIKIDNLNKIVYVNIYFYINSIDSTVDGVCYISLPNNVPIANHNYALNVAWVNGLTNTISTHIGSGERKLYIDYHNPSGGNGGLTQAKDWTNKSNVRLCITGFYFYN